jgi:NAD(P)H-hydrate epimerase
MAKALPVELDWELAARMLPGRDPFSRKGQNGRVLVVGGSLDYFGSPVLVALAALRAGADLVYLLVPEKVAPVAASFAPDLIVRSFPGARLSRRAVPLVGKLCEKADVLAIGNGLTKHPAVLASVRAAVSGWRKPLVIDADAIMPGIRVSSRAAVFTPHAVEFSRLFGSLPPSGRVARRAAVSALSRRLGAAVLLKGAEEDVSSDGSRVYCSRTGNAGMTCGGTGDTLAGFCAAFLAQGMEPAEAAALAAFVNGAAGDSAFGELGNSLTASDIVRCAPFVLKKIASMRQ